MDPGGPSLLEELAASICQYHEVDLFPQNVLRMDRIPVFQCPSIEVPSFGDLVTIEQIEDTVYWGFTVPETISDVVSFTSSERQTRSRIKYKIRHEFVAEALCMGGTDHRLDETFSPLNDEDDKLTPDISYKDHVGVQHIIEIGTSRSPSEFGLKKVFVDKMFKYEMPIRNRRLDGPVAYTIIIVGLSGVVSNAPLPENLVDELVVRMNIGVALENAGKSKGVNITSEVSDAIQNSIMQDILDRVSSMDDKPAKGNSKLEVTSEFAASVLEPADEGRVFGHFIKAMDDAKTEIQRDPKQIEVAKKFMMKLNSKAGTRSDKKPVCIMPLVLTRPASGSVDIPMIGILPGGENEELSSLWSNAFSQAQCSPGFKPEKGDVLLREALTTQKNTITKMEADRKVKQKKYHRVNMKPKLTHKVMAYLRRDGVFAKSAKNDPGVKARKAQQKKPFWGLTDTSDIRDFLEDSSLLEESLHDSPKPIEEVLKLIGKAEDLSRNGEIGQLFLKEWSKTKLFQAVDLASDIAIELAVALKQNSKSNEFILKKIRYRNVYILIKQTNSNSHMFYSLFIPDEEKPEFLHDTVFRGWKKIHRGYATDFVSIKASKIENWANASSHVLTMAAFWSEFYNLDGPYPHNFCSHKEASRSLLLTLLVLTEDKAQTEEVITNTRYMYMEIFKGTINIRKPRPFKMLPKFPSCIRSRLTLYLTKQIIKSFSSMVTHPPKRVLQEKPTDLVEGEDTLPGDEWSGLLNCFTGAQIRSATAAVNLMYIGYFKNKNETPEGNSEWKMVDKILEEEFGLKEEERGKSMGDSSPDNPPGKKQFDKHSIMFGCEILERRLSKSMGSDWKEQLEKEITFNLSRHLTHEIATLKASSTCDHNKTNQTATREMAKKLWRVKVLEAISCRLGLTGLNPMCNIDKVIRYIENSSAGVVCDLFKKSQHGGLREIYVLTVESRIVQLFIETIARTICSHFEEETLTHPENKIKILDNHKTRTAREAKLRDAIFADLNAAADKTRWNQNFVMPAMSIPLLRFTTPKFHNAIRRAINLWADKLILIPPNVLELLLNRTPLSSDTYGELLDKFWGRKSSHNNASGMRKERQPYLNLTTGMMQGILHYTSSLLHLTNLACAKYCALKFLRARHPVCRFSMAQVCSSDDSATIITVMTPPDTDSLSPSLVRAFFEADLVLETLAVFSRCFCMRDSVKSTTSVYDYIEFNSEFLFKNTLAIPTIKFVAACLNLTESESFVQRFQSMYNLLSDLRGSGLSSHKTYLCQVAQAWQHYKTLGSCTNILFSRFVEAILKTPSPVHGFFLLDNSLVAGLLGYSFCRWMQMTNCAEESGRLHLLKLSELEVLPDGGIVQSLCIKHGDLKRWHTLQDRIQQGTLTPREKTMTKDKTTQAVRLNDKMLKDRETLVNKDPELFFRHPHNVKELRVKLMIKASLPGVARSLAKGNPYIQGLSMSVYAIYAHAFSQTMTKSVMDASTRVWKKTKETTKHSLLSALQTHRMQTPHLLGQTELDNLLDEVFPLHRRYSDAYEVICSFDGSTLIQIPVLRHRTTVLLIQPKMSDVPLSLLQTVSKLWYQHNVRCSESVFKRCKEHFLLSFPWIRDTFESTLLQSPFLKPIELYNFLATQNSRVRRVRIVGPTIRSNRFVGQLSQLIRKGFMSCHILQKDRDVMSSPEVVDSLSSQLSLSLLIPLVEVRTKASCDILSRVSRTIGTPQDIKLLSRRQASLGLIALYHSSRIPKEDIPMHIRDLHNGIIVTFTRAQRRLVIDGKTHWKGQGECLVLADGVHMRLVLGDDTVSKIIVKSFDQIRKQPSTMRQVFDHISSRAKMGFNVAPGSVARFNGTCFTSTHGQGSPVFVDASLEEPYVDIGEVWVSSHYGKVGMYTTVREIPVPLIEYSTGPRDLSLYERGLEGTEKWRCWVECKKLRSPEAYNFLVEVMDRCGRRGPISRETEHLKKWVKDSLQARLSFRGIGFTDFRYAESAAAPSEESDAEMDEEVDALLMEMNSGERAEGISALFSSYTDSLRVTVENDLLEAAFAEGGEITDIQDVALEKVLQYEYELSPFRTILSNLTYEETTLGRSVTSREQFNYLYLHPFWDSFIDAVDSWEPGIFYKIFQGVVSAVNGDLSRVLMKLMEVKETTTELRITERFQRMARQRAAETSQEVDWWDQDEQPESSAREGVEGAQLTPLPNEPHEEGSDLETID